jgi:hypothetical protein
MDLDLESAMFCCQADASHGDLLILMQVKELGLGGWGPQEQGGVSAVW